MGRDTLPGSIGGRRETLLAGPATIQDRGGRRGRASYVGVRRGSRHPVVIASTLFVKFVVNDVSDRVAGPFRTVPDVL
ncbi:MAG: hypothetical protein DMF97_10300, partial [Acidobacteria bacterium]